MDPVLLYRDNIGAIDTASSQEIMNTGKYSRYIDIRYYITREALANSILRLQYCRTENIVADILTKSLSIIVYK